MGATSLSAVLSQAGDWTDTGGIGLWLWLRAKLDLAQYRPEVAAGVVARELTGREGPYTILKNPATHTYYRLGDRDAFLWQRMDGTRRETLFPCRSPR